MMAMSRLSQSPGNASAKRTCAIDAATANPAMPDASARLAARTGFHRPLPGARTHRIAAPAMRAPIPVDRGSSGCCCSQTIPATKQAMLSRTSFPFDASG
jgi:hypothetical protein